jgi:hypothetical protein
MKTTIKHEKEIRGIKDSASEDFGDDIANINTNTLEGKYLLAAIAKLTNELHTDKTPFEVMDMLGKLQKEMFK